MVINVLSRPGDAYHHFQHLLRGTHNTRSQQNEDILTTLALVKGLVRGGVVEKLPGHATDEAGRRYRLTQEMQRDFALNQPLSPFALAALDLLDPESDTYALDVVSTFEAILDDPRQLLQAQQRQARGDAIAELKAEGVDYTERMALVEEVGWPQPLREELEQAYEIFCQTAPWAREFELRPKSVVREMVEKAMTFSDLIAAYGLARSEGVILRYLSDAWHTLRHSVPESVCTEDLDDIIEWLGELIRQVDSSLMDEWARMADPDAPVSEEVVQHELAFGVTDPTALTANRRAFTIMVRNAMFRLVQLFDKEDEEGLAKAVSYLPDPPHFPALLDAYFDEYDDLDAGPEARGPEFFRLDTSGRRWRVRQILKDPDADNSFAFVATVDLDASDAAGEVRFADLQMEHY